jgi:thymidylate synthase
MNKLDKDYLALLQDILDNGVKKRTRNGEVLSVFGRNIRHSMKNGFPLLTTKKIHFKSVVSELLWFLQGRTDLRWLLEQGNTIWVGDAYANYIKMPKELSDVISDQDNFNGRNLSKEEFIERIKTDDEFAKKWGSLGKIYGHGWRNWNGKSDDELYEDYLKKVKKD